MCARALSPPPRKTRNALPAVRAARRGGGALTTGAPPSNRSRNTDRRRRRQQQQRAAAVGCRWVGVSTVVYYPSDIAVVASSFFLGAPVPPSHKYHSYGVPSFVRFLFWRHPRLVVPSRFSSRTTPPQHAPLSVL